MQSEYLRAAQRGSAAAFESLMGEYEKKIYGLCLRMMGNVHDGEDAAQEAMIRIWQKIGQCRDVQALSTWIYRVTASACTDAIRKRAKKSASSLEIMREDGFDPADSAPTPEQAAQDAERSEALTRAIAKVPPEMRSVFLLRDVHALSVEQTAKALGITQGTVKSRLFRARERIARAMRESGTMDGYERQEEKRRQPDAV
ncbi:MAG: RNA polymerase sigma factor [Clostridia bacterium]|nr:RNA polymerase sigma factor [Clostridia bacterium]